MRSSSPCCRRQQASPQPKPSALKLSKDVCNISGTHTHHEWRAQLLCSMRVSAGGYVHAHLHRSRRAAVRPLPQTLHTQHSAAPAAPLQSCLQGSMWRQLPANSQRQTTAGKHAVLCCQACAIRPALTSQHNNMLSSSHLLPQCVELVLIATRTG